MAMPEAAPSLGAGPAAGADAGAVARLRGLVHDCLAKHMYDGAAFFADKLATLSDNPLADVYLMAQVRQRWGGGG